METHQRHLIGWITSWEFSNQWRAAFKAFYIYGCWRVEGCFSWRISLIPSARLFRSTKRRRTEKTLVWFIETPTIALKRKRLCYGLLKNRPSCISNPNAGTLLDNSYYVRCLIKPTRPTTTSSSNQPALSQYNDYSTRSFVLLCWIFRCSLLLLWFNFCWNTSIHFSKLVQIFKFFVSCLDRIKQHILLHFIREETAH